MADPTLLLTVDEVATEMRCSDWPVKQLIKSGALPSIKVGGLRRVRRGDLETFIAGIPPSLPARGEAA